MAAPAQKKLRLDGGFFAGLREMRPDAEAAPAPANPAPPGQAKLKAARNCIESVNQLDLWM